VAWRRPGAWRCNPGPWAGTTGKLPATSSEIVSSALKIERVKKYKLHHASNFFIRQFASFYSRGRLGQGKEMGSHGVRPSRPVALVIYHLCVRARAGSGQSGPRAIHRHHIHPRRATHSHAGKAESVGVARCRSQMAMARNSDTPQTPLRHAEGRKPRSPSRCRSPKTCHRRSRRAQSVRRAGVLARSHMCSNGGGG